MRADRSWDSHAREQLKLAGHRAGGAREAVLGQLSEQDCCLTAQEIYDSLRDRNESIGLASVYRALELLDEMGLVRRIEIEGSAHYERANPSGEHHHHVICDGCGSVTAFEDAALERSIDRLARRLDHAVTGHDVVLRGRCRGCSE